ncbi:hypothetical protein LTR08_008935 [Meristemomyces frigidus]|nr:hypothetical protein LTR08_008935 [Meristemomyces frigidus]
MDDPNVGPGTSFVAHYHEQHHLEPKSELLVHERAASDARPESHLRPRSFEAPNRWFVVWFRGRKSNASGAGKRMGAHVDLRFFVPIVAAVCLVAALPLIFYYTLQFSLSEAWGEAYTGPYDCANESILLASRGINLIVFDNLSFTVAKAIDLAWNMLAGRGSQALAAFVCYRVFTGTLLLATEHGGVSAQTFAALGFSTTSIWCYGPTLKSVCRSKLGFLNKLAFVWILVSVTYLLFVATMVDLMTGYQTGQATWLKLPNGTFVDMQIGEYALIQNLYETIAPSNVTIPDDETLLPNWTLYTNPYIGGGPVRTAVFPSAMDSCAGQMLYERCLDATRNDLYLLNVTCRADGGWAVPVDYFTNSTTNQEYLDYDGELVTSYPDASCTNLFSLGKAFVNTGGPFYQIDQEFSQNASNYLCVPSADYRWGFSFQYLWMLTAINSIWLLITAVLWLDVELRSQLVQKRGRFGTWRAILDLATALQAALGRDTGAYGEEELERAVERLGPLAYGVDEDEVGGMERIALSECSPTESRVRQRLRLGWETKYC